MIAQEQEHAPSSVFRHVESTRARFPVKLSQMTDRPCPLCDDPYPADLVHKVRSAKPAGKPMTIEKFRNWLEQVAGQNQHP